MDEALNGKAVVANDKAKRKFVSTYMSISSVIQNSHDGLQLETNHCAQFLCCELE
jgi:hypothetical protein